MLHLRPQKRGERRLFLSLFLCHFKPQAFAHSTPTRAEEKKASSAHPRRESDVGGVETDGVGYVEGGDVEGVEADVESDVEGVQADEVGNVDGVQAVGEGDVEGFEADECGGKESGGQMNLRSTVGEYIDSGFGSSTGDENATDFATSVEVDNVAAVGSGEEESKAVLDGNETEPINEPHDWAKTSIEPMLPLIERKMSKRPKKNRRMTKMNQKLKPDHLSRKGLIMTYTQCGQHGHNKRSCTQGNEHTKQSSRTIMSMVTSSCKDGSGQSSSTSKSPKNKRKAPLHHLGTQESVVGNMSKSSKK
ncbi:hypothetical protein GOBAR_DD25730 [Gossypium barbadense]|nr:hypothetical protein GOBAR_DD25730 [Gossypium barbadense]